MKPTKKEGEKLSECMRANLQKDLELFKEEVKKWTSTIKHRDLQSDYDRSRLVVDLFIVENLISYIERKYCLGIVSSLGEHRQLLEVEYKGSLRQWDIENKKNKA